ncbi:TRAP transporter small permease [Cribrihabitans pelagius]|uniref:TRAP transporter small permease n=1 Tax=Cribrihabitans pelagius TaxID=1765746 RepID=UPI003B5C60A8
MPVRSKFAAAAPKGALHTCLALVLRAVNGLVRLAGAISTGLILLAFALTIYAVFQRYLMNAPLRWSDDVTGWALVALIMFGVAEAYRQDVHISIDLVTARLRGRAAKAQRAFADLAVLVFAAVLGISSWEAVSFARSFEAYTSGTVEVPLWAVQLPLVAGAALLALMALARILSRFAHGDET